MAGHYPDGEQWNEGNPGEHQDAHRDNPVEQRRDNDGSRAAHRGDSGGRDPEAERGAHHDEPAPHDGDGAAGWHSRAGGQGHADGPQDRRPLHQGSGNHGRDWVGERASYGAPEDAGGGGCGGPQDPYPRPASASGGLDDGRVFGGMPSSVPAARQGEFRGRGSDWSASQSAGAARDESVMSRGRTGAFRGIGSNGYQRSDERIKENICERISDDDGVDASEVSVAVSHGTVTVEGVVRDRATKHRIEDVIEACCGVREIHNRLRVLDRHRTSSSSQCVSGDTEQASGGRHESGQQQPGTGKI